MKKTYTLGLFFLLISISSYSQLNLSLKGGFILGENIKPNTTGVGSAFTFNANTPIGNQFKAGLGLNYILYSGYTSYAQFYHTMSKDSFTLSNFSIGLQFGVHHSPSLRHLSRGVNFNFGLPMVLELNTKSKRVGLLFSCTPQGIRFVYNRKTTIKYFVPLSVGANIKLERKG